ncbi:polyprotein [Didelphis aurita hepatitis A virus]|uniref:Genome polyprotein n=1 Tax=Didelphis aurita hepatitis A virus TaxID=2200757 RepID=A0A2S1ZDM5_9PICO|nr:polyprotein [Didelphis aurita hepatitis A virus]
MNGIMALFQNIGEGLDKILSLADVEEEQMIQSVDRTAVAGASYFTSVDQSSVHSAEVGSHQKERIKTSVDLPGSKKTQGEKFFLIHTAEWQTTNALFHEVAKLDVVKLLYDEQYAVLGLLKYHTYARFGLEVQVQINPTPFQQGGLIAAMVPADQGYGSIASLPVYPHGLLNCNINNVVRIKVPFVYTRGAYNFRDPQYPVWELTIRVWSELNIGTGTTPYTSVNVLARFTDLELHGLTPIMTQMMRNEFRVSTTENVVNLSNYEDSRAKISIALDQEKWLEDSSEGGGIVITHFSTWTKIPTLATQFAFNSSATVGQQIKVIPVDPYYYQMLNTSPDQKCITALASICQMYCFWRGDIVFDFQVFPTKYHSGRLLFSFVPGNENMDVSKITLKRATTGPCALMDITGVQSTLRFRVPWISDTPYRVNRYTKASHIKGEYTAIGKVIVFCYNRLASPQNVAPHVRVNVYMSAINLECFAPIYHAMENTGTVAQAGDDMEFSTTETADQNVPDQEIGLTTPRDLKGKANVGKMDVAGIKPPVGAVTTIEDPILAKKVPETFPEVSPGKSRHTSDHMSLYKFMGRGHFLATWTFKADNMQYTLPLTLSASSDPPHGLPSTLRWFFNLFQLYRGPLDLTIVITGATDVDGLIWFTPTGLAVDTPWVEKASALSIDYKTSLGAVRFNTRRTGNIQVRLPWYSYLHAISGVLDGDGDKSDSTFGSVSVQIANYNRSDEYLSFSCYLSVTSESQFMFPRAPLNSNAMKTSTGVMARISEGDLESCVDEVRDESDLEFERNLESRRPVRFYKEARLELGKMQIRQALEDLRAKVCSQSGPISLFYCELDEPIDVSLRGVAMRPNTKRRFAFMYNECFYMLGESNGKNHKQVLTGKIVKAPGDMNWQPMSNVLIEDILAKLVKCPSWRSINFGEGILDFEKAVSKVYDKELAETTDLKEKDLIALLNFLHPKTVNVSDRLLGGSGIKEVVFESKHLIKECQSFLGSIKESLSSFMFGFKTSVAVEVVNFVLSLIKCGLLSYISQRLSDLGENGLCNLLRVLNIIDIGCSTISLGKVISHLLNQAFEWQTEERLLKLHTQGFSDWLKDVSTSITVFRGLKDAVKWIYSKVKEYYDLNYGERKAILEALKENQSKIEAAMEKADEFCLQQIQDVEKHEEYKRGVQMMQSLRTVHAMALVDPQLSKYLQPLRDVINRVYHKLRNLGAINQAVVTRSEPVVCYLHGKRGGGKSLTSLALATKICKQMGVDPKKNIYTKPIGSDYWDGYCGQLVCIIDDIGQSTDDEDWSDFCQLVSGCPMRLNMASLDEKGRHFSSPFIICTSNWSNPNPKTVYVKEAIDRRLHFKIEVKPVDFYKTPNSEMLNVNLAKKDGKIQDMSCLDLLAGSRKVTLSELVEMMVGVSAVRISNMDEFMKLWSQSGDDDFSKEFASLFDDTEPKQPGVLSRLWEAITSHKWMVLGAGVGVLGLLVGGWYAYSKFMKEDSEIPACGVYHGVSRPKQVIKLDADPAESQSTLEIAALVRKNLVQFGIGEKGGSVRWVMNALGIKDDWLLVPSHAYKFEPNYESLEFYFQRNGTYYSISAGNVLIHSLDVGFQDVVLMKVPTLPKFRDITEHFVKKKDLERAASRLATLVTSVGGNPMMISEGPLKIEDKATYAHKNEDGTVTDVTIDMAWRGRGDGCAGMCGGALISSNQSIQNAILGVHVAGGHGTMVAKVVTQEMLVNIEERKIESQRIMKVEFTQSSVNVVSKTLFKKTPFYKYIDENMINHPAVMPYQKDVEIDPMAVMLSKYDHAIVEEPYGYLDSVNYYANKILGKQFLYTENLTLEQAIMGVEGVDKLNMDSSPGFPYVSMGYTKEDLIWIEDDQFIGIHPILKTRLDFNLAMIDNGNQMDVVYMTCPKDELRPMEKVLQSKTRAIDACPVDFTIICRMFWGPAISYFQLNPGFHTGSAVGIDPDSDWNSLAETMLRFGDIGIDLDFSAYDASLSPFMIEHACGVLSYMSGIAAHQGRVLCSAICYSTHVLANLQYTVLGSMPSGSPCTSLLNTIVNNINLYYVLGKIFKKKPIFIGDKVRIICYGDDVMIVFARGLRIRNIERLGALLVREFEILGMTATSASKGVPSVVPVLDLTFLKRRFHLVVDKFRPAIAEKTIWSLIAWMRSRAELSVNVDTACWFAFMHGRSFFEHFKHQLDMYIKQEMLDFQVKSYEWYNLRFNALDFTRDLT